MPGSYPPAGQFAPPGVPMRRPSTAPAYLCAALFLPAVVLTYVAAIVSTDGSVESTFDMHMLSALVAVTFSDDVTGNIDFAVSMSYTYLSVVLLFVVLLCIRLGFARWVGAALGFVAVVYYFCAMIYFLSNDATEMIVMPLVLVVLWLIPAVVAVLPPTGRAMRGYRPRPLMGMPMGPSGYGYSSRSTTAVAHRHRFPPNRRIRQQWATSGNTCASYWRRNRYRPDGAEGVGGLSAPELR
ncbi:hypothetical protein ACFSVJ_16815 [Prauserella oleivorans]